MKIKIKGHNQEHLKNLIARIMNLSCIAFNRGKIPTEKDMQEPEKSVMYWYENINESKYELLPIANNHKAFVRDRGENFIVIEFHSRYDDEKKEVNALSNLILAFFYENEVEAIN